MAQPNPSNPADALPDRDLPRLSPADAQAVDLVLDRPSPDSSYPDPASPSTDAGATDDGLLTSAFSAAGLSGSPQGQPGTFAMSGFSSTSPDDLPARIDGAEGVLKVLDHLPADEPAGDLVQRTMSRITHARDVSASAGDAASLGSAPSAVPNQRPTMKDDAPESA